MDLAVALWIALPLAAIHLGLRRRRGGLAFQLLLDVALLALPLRPLLLGNHIGPGVPDGAAWGAPVTVSGSPEQVDLPVQFHVWWAEVRRLTAQGRPPWISERIGGGLPLFSHGQTGVPFPLQAPVWALGPERGTDVMAAWKLELAALGAFLLLGRLGLRPAAAAAGAFSFALAPYVVSWLVVPLAWVVAGAPWALWAALGALRGRRRDAALLAVLLGVLAGWSVHPESAAFLWAAVALAGLVLGWPRPARIARLAPAFVLAVAVAAIGAVPTVAAIRASAKLTEAEQASGSYAARGSGWGPRARLAALAVAPWREGSPADGTWRWPFANAAVAVGVPATALVLALAALPRRRHRRAALLGGLLVGAGAVLVWQLPPFADVLARTPVVRTMTWSRAGFLIPLGVAIVAGLAADSWLRRPRRGRAAVAALGVQALVVLLVVSAPRAARSRAAATVAFPAVAGTALVLGGPAAAWSLPALAVLETVGLSWHIVPASRPSPTPALLEGLQRRMAAEGGRLIGLDGALPPNLAARQALADLRANDPLRPLGLARLHQAFGSVGMALPGPLTRADAALAGEWAVRWLLTPEDGLAQPEGEGWEEVLRGPAGRVYRNRQARSPVAGTCLGVESSVFEPTRVSARLRSDAGCELLVRVPASPGWRASIDGRAAELGRGPFGELALRVGAGEHEVVLSYVPPGLWLGITLGAAGLVGSAVLARRRR